MRDEPKLPDVPPADPAPGKVLAFDSSKADPARQLVDLDAPFFEIVRPKYDACDHRRRGVTVDVATRRVFCRCGEQMDAFDALLVYAHAEQRVQADRRWLEEAQQKEREAAERERFRRPFARKVTGWQRLDLKRRRAGFGCTLECGHAQRWVGRRRHPPRTMTCEACVRKAELERRGAAVLPPAKP